MVFFEKNKAHVFCPGLYGETVGYTVGEDIGIVCSEDEVYERLCEAADASIGIPITAVLRFEGTPGEREQTFRSRVRAVYRASVWGQFSLLCVGASLPEHVCSIYEALRDAFCELESEGREFNGFIKKGIEIDTPLLLYKFPTYLKFDFFCFDIDRLMHLCACRDESDALKRVISDDILSLCSSSHGTELAVRSLDVAQARRISDCLPSESVKRIYVK